MRAVPDYRPSVVPWCPACEQIKDDATTGECPECGRGLLKKVRLGADLLDHDDPALDKYKRAGEI